MSLFSLKKIKERWIYDAFLITVIIKGLDGLLEVIVGLLLIFTDTFSEVVFFLTRNEIIDDPNNYFATHLRAFASQSHQAFVVGGMYLVVHGILKAFISGSLWRNYAWAYPAAMTLLSLFISYEVIRIGQTGSIPLIGLAIFDVIMLGLVGHEYKKLPHRV